MRITTLIKRIKGRLDGVLEKYRFHYYLYIKYFNDTCLFENTILFETFNGLTFQGDAFYILRYLTTHSEYASYKCIIASVNPDAEMNLLKKRGIDTSQVKIVEYLSKQYIYYLCHSKYLVNGVSFNTYYIKKEGQVYLNTCHGTPLKFLGKRAAGDPFNFVNGQRNYLLADYLIEPCSLVRDIYLDDYMIRGICDEKMQQLGYPRNTPFFEKENQVRIKEREGETNNTVIVYMPTWRGEESIDDSINAVRIIDSVSGLLGETYSVYIKLHPKMKKLDIDYRHCKDVPEDYEINEFLSCADILITDYSSVYFDFACKNSNIILFQYDLQEYLSSRGVYVNMLSQTPFPVAFNQDELIHVITEKKHFEGYNQFLKTFCSEENGYADKRIVELLIESKPKNYHQKCSIIFVDTLLDAKKALELIQNGNNQNLRIMFKPQRSNNYFRDFDSFDKVNYMILPESGLLLKEKIVVAFFGGIKRFQNFISKLASREKSRLWGDLTFEKSFVFGNTKLPFVLRYSSEEVIRLED